MTENDAQRMAERMNQSAPAGMHYEPAETERQLDLEQGAESVTPFYVRRVRTSSSDQAA